MQSVKIWSETLKPSFLAKEVGVFGVGGCGRIWAVEISKRKLKCRRKLEN
jgi:hypothetical protein